LLLEELESTLAAWFKQSCEGNASIDGTHLKEEVLHISIYLGLVKFSASNGWIDTFKRRHNVVYRTQSGESRSVDPETLEDWKSAGLVHDVYNAHLTGLFFIFN
jgi:hypothetical protein